METLLRERIKKSGFKMNYLAEQIGVTKSYFSLCMSGARNLSKDKQNKLKSLLS